MIYILHGEDIPSIRNFILKLQREHNVGAKRELAIEETNPAEIAELASSVDMFGNTSMVVLDVTKMGRMSVKAYIEVLVKVPQDLVFVVFAGKKLSKANAFLKNDAMMGAKVMPFKQISQSSVFKFMDHVFSGDREASYKELRKLILAGEDPFYVFSMLLYGLRNISYAKFDSMAFSQLSPFVKSKTKAQSRSFSEDQVKDLYDKFYELDIGAKSGVVSTDLLVVKAVESVFAKYA